MAFREKDAIIFFIMRHFLNSRVRLHQLPKLCPNMKQSYPLGCIVSDKGTLTPLMLEKNYQYIAVIGFKKNVTRGKHYHKLKKEMFFVIHGDIKLIIADKDSMGSKEEIVISDGDLVEIDAGVWHSYEPLSDADALDISPDLYVDGDTFQI